MGEGSFFSQAARFLFRAAAIVLVLLVFITLMEILRAFRLAHAFSPALGWTVAAAAVIVAGWGAARAYGFLEDRRSLAPPPLLEAGSATFEELKETATYFVHVFKRLGANPHLDDETRKRMRQEAYDIEELLGHHPLLDDLHRIAAQSRQNLGPVTERLRERARRLARERMKFVVQDVVEPPLPLMPSMVMAYHQVALVSDLVNTYLSRPALFEYAIVMKDVWLVLTEGRFLSLGQNLFAKVYGHTPPLGPAMGEIGSALSAMWATRIVALTAMLRCEATVEWDPAEASGRVEALTDDSLTLLRQALLEDVLPILDVRLRHAAPAGVVDTAAFARNAIDGVAKAIDSVAATLRKRPTESQAILERRQTIHDEPPASEEATREEFELRRSGSRRRRQPRGVWRIFRTFGQRIRYTMGARPS